MTAEYVDNNVVAIDDGEPINYFATPETLAAHKQDVIDALELLKQRVAHDQVQAICWVWTDVDGLAINYRIAKPHHTANLVLRGMAAALVDYVNRYLMGNER